ncbi:hypothetical protein Tco_0365845 [Tanacetum coccineum]
MEQICANFENKNKVQDQSTQTLSSRIFTLENHDLYSKFDKYINENVKEAIQDALQAPVHEHFRELSEFEMKEILLYRMFKSNSYRSQPEHTTLYETLEASMDCENREEFMDVTAKSRKRRRDDQDPPPPPPKDSDQSKKKRHDSDASASQQPQAQTSLAWKSSDTREAPSSSSQHKTAPQSEQLVDDILIPDDVHISDSKDAGTAHLIKTRRDWLKPVPEEERPETPKPDWIGKSKLNKADLEGPAFKVVRPFHENSISLRFQMEECHLVLTDQIDLVNPEGNRVMPDVSKPLPLGGPPGQVTIQPQYFFNKDLESLVSGNKERRNALSISKLKAAYYQDFRLEELVPSLWIESSVVSLKTFS